MAFFVYILQSEFDQSFYVGYINDLVRRLPNTTLDYRDIPARKFHGN
jgi:predicted GIY-YIG superfamily endonuclease